MIVFREQNREQISKNYLFQCLRCVALSFGQCMRVDVCRSAEIGMPKKILSKLEIASLIVDKAACAMPEGITNIAIRRDLFIEVAPFTISLLLLEEVGRERQ